MDRVIIAAVAENGVIGDAGDIPWHYPDDFKHFKETTSGHPVIMGRVTYEGIVNGLGGPLPERQNIVLSFEDMDVSEHDTVVNVHSIEDALAAAAETGDDTVYVAGGASIYEQFLEQDLVDRMIITEIPETPDGDTYFPEWDASRWEETDRRALTDELTVVTYERRE